MLICMNVHLHSTLQWAVSRQFRNIHTVKNKYIRIEMNTNRDASQLTKYNRAKALAAYHEGNVRLVPGSYSDMSSSTYTEIIFGQTKCCLTNSTSTNTSSSNTTYTTYYSIFTTLGSSTWTAPSTCQSPITYWIVGGGGGGSGAYDQRGNGGGGGGFATTGTYAVVAGTTYDVVVGAGGAGGTGRGTLNVITGPFGSDTDGTDGIDSSFDIAGGGPVAAGGGKGLDGTTGTLKAGGTGGEIGRAHV